MNRRLLLLLTGLFTFAALALSMTLVVVREGEAAVITTFGRPVRTLDAPGLYARWPQPIQAVHRYDTRLRTLSAAPEQVQTRDGKNLIVTVYAAWKIADPLLFLQRVGQPSEGERGLQALLRNAKTAVVGQHPLSALINTDVSRLQFEQIEQNILDGIREEARQRYGVEVAIVGISRLSLPESITEGVFGLMKAEREQLASLYRSEGERESVRLRADAESERDRILAEAEAQARKIEAEGDALAAEHFKAFQENPELAILLRKIEALKNITATRTTVVLGTETTPFDLLERPTPPAAPEATAP